MANNGGEQSAGLFGSHFGDSEPDSVARLFPALSDLDVLGLAAAGKMALDVGHHLLLDSLRSLLLSGLSAKPKQRHKSRKKLKICLAKISVIHLIYHICGRRNKQYERKSNRRIGDSARTRQNQQRARANQRRPNQPANQRWKIGNIHVLHQMDCHCWILNLYRGGHFPRPETISQNQPSGKPVGRQLCDSMKHGLPMRKRMTPTNI